MSKGKIHISILLRLTSWLWMCVILILPLLMVHGFPERFEFPKAILLTFAGLFSWATVFAHFSQGGFLKYWRSIQRPQKILLGLLLTFSLWSFVSNLFASTQPMVSLFGQAYRFQGHIFFLSVAGLVAFIVMGETMKLGTARLFVRAICFSGLLAVVSLLVQWVLNAWSPSIFLPSYFGRMNGFFGNPNFAASYVALTWIWWKVGLTPKLRWFLLPLWLVAILVTQSRGAMVALVISVLLDLGWSAIHRQSISNFRLLVSITVFASVLLLGMVGVFVIRPIDQAENRDLIWQKAVRAIQEKPLLGWGYEQFRLPFTNSITHDDPIRFLIVDKVHNEWLEMGVATGIPGLILYLSIWIFTFIALWQQRRLEFSQTALICLLSSITIVGTNIVSVSTHVILFMVLAISLQASHIQFKSKKEISR